MSEASLLAHLDQSHGAVAVSEKETHWHWCMPWNSPVCGDEDQRDDPFDHQGRVANSPTGFWGSGDGLVVDQDSDPELIPAAAVRIACAGDDPKRSLERSSSSVPLSFLHTFSAVRLLTLVCVCLR
ncbi:hypothetical protein [Planctomycetes bacterium CA13]